MARTGRPTKYSPEVAADVCAWLSEGRTLTSWCNVEKNPSHATVMNWLEKYPNFLEEYKRARQRQADAFFEQTLDIADDGRNDTYIDERTGFAVVDHDVVHRSKLRVQARQWAAARLSGKYLERQAVRYEDAEGRTIAPVINVTIAKPSTDT